MVWFKWLSLWDIGKFSSINMRLVPTRPWHTYSVYSKLRIDENMKLVRFFFNKTWMSFILGELIPLWHSGRPKLPNFIGSLGKQLKHEKQQTLQYTSNCAAVAAQSQRLNLPWTRFFFNISLGWTVSLTLECFFSSCSCPLLEPCFLHWLTANVTLIGNGAISRISRSSGASSANGGEAIPSEMPDQLSSSWLLAVTGWPFSILARVGGSPRNARYKHLFTNSFETQSVWDFFRVQIVKKKKWSYRNIHLCIIIFL